MDSYGDDTDDWDNVVDEEAEEHVDESLVRLANEKEDDKLSDELILAMATIKVPSLKPHVIDWLNENVKDRDDPECPKGWAIGNTEYRATNAFDMTIFFHRHRDALAFIKQFSKWGKPEFYHNYFKDIRKRLNEETNKLEEIK